MNDCTTPLSVCLFVFCNLQGKKLTIKTPLTNIKNLSLLGLYWGGGDNGLFLL